MRFFDCSCSVGKRSVLGSNMPEDLLSKMDRYGIEKTIIYHTIAKEHHPITGNNQLLTMLNDILIPNWVILPKTGDEFYSPIQLAEQMKNSNVKIVSMFPNEHNKNT